MSWLRSPAGGLSLLAGPDDSSASKSWTACAISPDPGLADFNHCRSTALGTKSAQSWLRLNPIHDRRLVRSTKPRAGRPTSPALTSCQETRRTETAPAAPAAGRRLLAEAAAEWDLPDRTCRRRPTRPSAAPNAEGQADGAAVPRSCSARVRTPRPRSSRSWSRRPRSGQPRGCPLVLRSTEVKTWS